jgi:hypothetical protein
MARLNEGKINVENKRKMRRGKKNPFSSHLRPLCARQEYERALLQKELLLLSRGIERRKKEEKFHT